MKLCPYQDGLYLRLRDHYMETKEPLPDDDAALARICGISPTDFAPHAAKIREFFRPKKGQLFNKTCEEVLNFQNGAGKRRTEKAKKGAKVLWEKKKKKQEVKSSEHKPSIPQAMLGDAIEQNIREKNKEKKEPPTPKGGLELLPPWPDWVPAKEFSDYIENRRKLKSPMTQRAIELAIVELSKLNIQGYSPIDVINQSIMNGWKGLFPIKGDFHAKSSRTQRPGPADAIATGFSQAGAILDLQDERGGRK